MIFQTQEKKNYIKKVRFKFGLYKFFFVPIIGSAQFPKLVVYLKINDNSYSDHIICVVFVIVNFIFLTVVAAAAAI